MHDGVVFLVVDDMDGMRRILVNMLHQIGIKNVISAMNGAEAWHIMQNKKIEVVITDWNMPLMNGLALLDKIRTSTSYANLPVLMMTSENDRYQVRTAIEAGVSGYLIKPFNISALESQIKKIMAHPHPAPATSATSATAAPLRPVPALLLGDNKGAGYEALLQARLALSNQGATAKADANAGTHKATVLVVDDIPDNLDILVALLGDAYTMRAANSGERALKIIQTGNIPDLILLDVMMPDMDGFEVCRRIKANPATAAIPVIFLSTMTESVDLAKGFAVGAVDFITKPADPPILMARIDTQLRLRQSFIELEQSRSSLLAQNTILEDNLRLRDEVERMSQHDLKSPLAGIIGFASILLGESALAEEHKEMIGHIEQSAYRVLNMVNLSLDLYKMEQGSYEFSPNIVDLYQLMARIIKEKAHEMASRSLTVEMTQPRNADGADGAADNAADSAADNAAASAAASVRVLGDELLCYSMLSNLYKNAMEAAPADSVIRVKLVREPDWVNLRMSNGGVVPREIRQQFFEKFSTAGKSGGTGLGTFSARLIAQTQGGDISMQTSDEQQTTTISVRLPTVPLE